MIYLIFELRYQLLIAAAIGIACGYFIEREAQRQRALAAKTSQKGDRA